MFNEKELKDLNNLVLKPGKAHDKMLFEYDVINEALEIKLKSEVKTINHIVNYLINISNEYKNDNNTSTNFIVLSNLDDDVSKELELEITRKLSTDEIYHSVKILNIRVFLRNILSEYIEKNNLVVPILRMITTDIKSTIKAKEKIVDKLLKDITKGGKVNVSYYNDKDILYYIYLIDKELDNYGSFLKGHCILVAPNTFNLYDDDINPIAILEEVYTNTNIELISHEH